MEAISRQLSAISKNVGTRNETRENKMFVNNEEMTKETPVGAVSTAIIGTGGIAAKAAPTASRAWTVVTVLAAALFAPQISLAQNECGLQLDPGNPETVTCNPGDYNDGITYDSLGDLTLEVPDAASVDLDVFEAGVNVTGNGADNLFWDSSAFVSGEIAGTGVVMDYLSDTGNVDILIGGDIRGLDDATHIIRAESSGGGSVSVTTLGEVNPGAENRFISPPSRGIGIEALTTSGAITIDAAGGTVGAGDDENATHAIRALSDSGDITISVDAVTTGFNPVAVVNLSPVVGRRGIEAVTGGGDIAITSVGNISTSGRGATVNSARSDGIRAETSGAGTVTLDLDGNVIGTGTDGAAIRIINGTGDVFIDTTGEIRGGESTSTSSEHRPIAAGLVVDSGGDITVETESVIMGGVNAAGPRTPAIVASGQTFSLTLTGDLDVLSADVQNYRASLGGFYTGDGWPSSASGRISTGLSDVVGPPSSRYSGGHIDLSGVTGGAVLNFNDQARWVVNDTSLLSAGDDVVNFDATSILITSQTNTNTNFIDGSNDADQSFIPPGEIDFGDGTDVLNNQGQLLVGPVPERSTSVGGEPDLPPTQGRFGMRGELRLFNLEQFNNAGEIWLGPMFFREGGATPTGPTRTDGWHDDLLYMPGTTFHGEAGSIIHMDVDLSKTDQQQNCAPSTRDADGWLPAADCVGIQGGAATGRTELRIVELVSGDRGSFNLGGIVLIDLAGGDPEATDPGAFVISPDNPRYADLGPNGSIDKGLFLYALAFDSELQQFRLYGVPSTGGQQFPMLATAANQLWRTATGGWFERRVNQRDVEREAGLGTGAWFNLSRNDVERDVITTINAGAAPDFVFNNDYDQDDTTVSFGWDLISHGAGAGSWVAGGMVGYARSEIDFEASGNSAELEGVHVGLYGGYTIGEFFVDAALNGTFLSLHNDVPTMDLEPAGTLLDTDVESLGLQLEAGWRWRTGALSVEPLVGLSVVSTDFDDMRVPADDPTRFGGTVKLSDSESQRASVGARVALEDLFSREYPVALNLTARVIEEFDGESRVTIVNTGPLDAPAADKFDDTLFQLTGGVSVTNAPKTLNGYLNVDAMTGSDYDSLGVSAGFRYQW